MGQRFRQLAKLKSIVSVILLFLISAYFFYTAIFHFLSLLMHFTSKAIEAYTGAWKACLAGRLSCLHNALKKFLLAHSKVIHGFGLVYHISTYFFISIFLFINFVRFLVIVILKSIFV